MDYTNHEIEETLTEMGYSAEDDAIEEIRQLLCNDTDNVDLIFDEISLLLENSNNENRQPPQEIYDKYPQMRDLISYGHDTLNALYHEIHDIDKEIEAALNDCDPELRQTLIQNLNRQDEEAARMYHHSETLPDIAEEEEEPPAPQKGHDKPATKDKPKSRQGTFQPTKTLPNFEFDEENNPISLDREVEKALLAEVLKEKGAVAVACPPPGKAPFKHDPVKRNAQYREAWKKFPAPGEKRRASLRWRIRNIMINRDIPHLKLVPNPGLVPRPAWTD